MGVNSLPPTQAFNPGADLWVVGLPEESTWALKIDWEINFQILRAAKHVSPRIAPELNELLNVTDLRTPTPPVSSPALLIAADLNLPCRWVLSLEEWKTPLIEKAWRDLGQPTLRVFLPRNQNPELLTQEWRRLSDSDDFQVVLE